MSGDKTVIKQGAGRLSIDVDTGDIYIHDNIHDGEVFISIDKWSEVKEAIDRLIEEQGE